MFENNENGFVNKNYSPSAESIINNYELVINFKIGNGFTQKQCLVNGEKIDFKGLIQLRISEKLDHSKMYLSTIDMASFNELKQEQSLNVTFAGFIENLIKIVNDCQKGNLQINLIQGKDDQLLLQFYEIRSFKNLIHLCLPIKVAPLSVVLFYINSVVDDLQKNKISNENAIQSMQHEIKKQLNRISMLETENDQLRNDIVAQDTVLTNRLKDEIFQLQQNLKKANEQRDYENERNKQAVAVYQSKLDKLNAEKASLVVEKNGETKKAETLKEELCLLKSNIANLKDQNEKLHGEVASLKNLERKNEMHLSDSKKQKHELQEKIKKYEKLKSELIAEIEAEKKICHTKRSALEMAMEEITKANEIITKQSQELIKLKQTVGWRTEVALQQECAIREKEKNLAAKSVQIANMQKTIDELRKEIPSQLESIKSLADSIELKYSEKINELNRKITINGKENKYRDVRARR